MQIKEQVKPKSSNKTPFNRREIRMKQQQLSMDLPSDFKLSGRRNSNTISLDSTVKQWNQIEGQTQSLFP